jgi:hypothetical protein
MGEQFTRCVGPANRNDNRRAFLQLTQRGIDFRIARFSRQARFANGLRLNQGMVDVVEGQRGVLSKDSGEALRIGLCVSNPVPIAGLQIDEKQDDDCCAKQNAEPRQR